MKKIKCSKCNGTDLLEDSFYYRCNDCGERIIKYGKPRYLKKKTIVYSTGCYLVYNPETNTFSFDKLHPLEDLYIGHYKGKLVTLGDNDKPFTRNIN